MVGKIAVFLYTHDFPGSLELLDWLRWCWSIAVVLTRLLLTYGEGITSTTPYGRRRAPGGVRY